MKTTLNIEGMMCMGCVKRVTKKLESIGCTGIEVSLEEKKASFDAASCDEKTAKDAIEELGFEVKF